MGARRLTFWIGVSMLAAAAAASACGGSSTNVAKQNRGAAGAAAGQYFIQEAAGGKLPEGTNVADRGTDNIVVLPLTSDDKKQSVKARYCVAYKYVSLGPGTPNLTRVYIAKLLKDGGWSVETVKPDGNCDGVQ